MPPKQPAAVPPDPDEGRYAILDRAAQAQFGSTLRKGAKYKISHRIVIFGVEEDSPWSQWVGEVVDRDSEGWTIAYTENNVPMGKFNFPPPEIEGGIVEVRQLEKLSLTPAMSTMQKRARSPEPKQTDKSELKEMVESLTGQEFRPKTTVCPGLRVSEDNSDVTLYHPFMLFAWFQIFSATAPRGTSSNLAAWKMELLQSVTDFGVKLGDAPTYELTAYNTARDQLGRWFCFASNAVPGSKEEWAFGFLLLFDLCATIVTMKHGPNRGGQLKRELTSEFHKGSAIIDVPSVLGRVFFGRPRGGSAYIRNSRLGKLHPGAIPGAAAANTPLPTIPGQPIQRICRYCRKPHTGPPGKDFWKTHQC